MSAGDSGELHAGLVLAEEAIVSTEARVLDVQARLDSVRTTLSVVREILATTENELAVALAEARDARLVRRSRWEAWVERCRAEMQIADTAAET